MVAWHILKSEDGSSTALEVEVTLRPTVSRPVCPGVRRPSGTRDQFYFLLEIFFRQLRFCNFVATSLTRGRVCNLLYNCILALPEKSLLGRSPAELTVHILLSHLRLHQPGGPGSKSKSHYDRQSVGQSVLVSGAHLGPATNFSFSLSFFF
jgi:hypothetical protein